MKRLNIGLILGLLAVNAMAEMPKEVKFQEGESIKLVLSKINLNRVFVKGDKITQIRYPEKAFAIDTSGIEDSESGLDSVYIKPVFDGELTLFVTTNKNHNFSIQVSSDDSEGKTVQMIPSSKRHKKPAHASITQNTKEIKTSLNEEIIEDMAQERTPKEFNLLNIKGQPFYIQKVIKAKPIKVYQGNNLKSYVYEIENKSKSSVALKNEWFTTNKNIRAMRLEKGELQPGEKTHFYAVYNDDSRSVG